MLYSSIFSFAFSLTILPSLLLFFALSPQLTTATQAGLPYNPVNTPNPLLRPQRRRSRISSENIPGLDDHFRFGRQLAYTPTCIGSLLLPDDAPWPDGHVLAHYDQAQQLCVAAQFGGLLYPDGTSANMGGVCFQNRLSKGMGDGWMIPFFDLDEDYADPIFYQSLTLRHRCYHACRCRPMARGMKFSVIRFGREQRRPMGDVNHYGIDGLPGRWAKKKDEPMWMSDMQSGAYRDKMSYKLGWYMTVVDQGDERGAVLAWKKRELPTSPVFKGRDACDDLQLTKGPLLLGLMNDAAAACLGLPMLSGKRDLTGQEIPENGMEEEKEEE